MNTYDRLQAIANNMERNATIIRQIAQRIRAANKVAQ